MRLIYFFLILCLQTVNAQSNWDFFLMKKKVTIPFKISNNAIVLQPKINGVKLNMFLDTGSAVNVLFNFPAQDSLVFTNTTSINVTGPGLKQPIKGVLAQNNKVEFNNLKNEKFNIILLLEGEQNFSTNIGLPIHGIMGTDFFKNNNVEINYITKKITFYRTENRKLKRNKAKFKALDFTFKENKPYVPINIALDNAETKTFELLIDTGLSDGIWLFEKRIDIANKKQITDFLGNSLGGEIFGKKTRFNKVSISDFELNQPILSFPDSLFYKKDVKISSADGSLGGDMLCRFKIIFDYPNQKMYLEKNSNFNKPFVYNIAGINLQNNGLDVFEEKKQISSNGYSERKNANNAANNTTISFGETNYEIKYILKPGIEVAYIRQNSEAEKAGLKVGDKIIAVNNINVTQLSIEKIAQMFNDDTIENIDLKIVRNTITYNFSIKMESQL